MASKSVRKYCTIENKHEEYIEEHDLNASHLLREAIEDQMQKDQH